MRAKVLVSLEIDEDQFPMPVDGVLTDDLEKDVYNVFSDFLADYWNGCGVTIRSVKVS